MGCSPEYQGIHAVLDTRPEDFDASQNTIAGPSRPASVHLHPPWISLGLPVLIATSPPNTCIMLTEARRGIGAAAQEELPRVVEENFEENDRLCRFKRLSWLGAAPIDYGGVMQQVLCGACVDLFICWKFPGEMGVRHGLT